MEAIQYLKNIYTGRENILRHICLFSVFGILAIAVTKSLAHSLGLTYFGYAPSSLFETEICIILSIMIILFMIGYGYNYSNSIFKEKNELPDITLKSYIYFIKMVPIILIYTAYTLFLIFIGLSAFNLKQNTHMAILYLTIILFFMPFVQIILLIYSKDFKQNLKLYNPATIFKILPKTISPIINFLIYLIPVFFIFILVPYYICEYSNNLVNFPLKLCLRILSLTFWIYFIQIIYYVYLQGLVNIIKSKSLEINE